MSRTKIRCVQLGRFDSNRAFDIINIGCFFYFSKIKSTKIAKKKNIRLIHLHEPDKIYYLEMASLEEVIISPSTFFSVIK